MIKSIRFFILLLLFITLLKNLIWSIVTPVWAGPDEPAQFGYSQFYSKTNDMPELYKPFISKEVVESTKLLEIEKINFHSNVIFSFSRERNSFVENKIRNFPDIYSNSFTSWAPLGIHPPLYYFFTGSVLNFLPNLDLFNKVYALRFMSILLSVATVFIAYKITNIIFKGNIILTLTIPLLVSFQPMMTFVNSIINNDNLLIFLFSLFIYFIVLLIYKNRLNLLTTLCLSTITALCLLSKQQSIALVIPFLVTYIIYAKIKNKLKIIIPHLMIFFAVIAIIDGWYYWNLFSKNMILVPIDPSNGSKLIPANINIFQYFLSVPRFKTIFNYYWGTFGWLDTTLPFLMHIIFLILTSLSFLGIIIKLYKLKLKIKFNKFNYTMLIFFISIASLFGIIFGYDFMAVKKTGGHWMQGRYLLPAIIPTMTILFLGIKELLKIKIAIILTTIIIIGSNLYSLFFSLIPRYYGSDINLWVQRIRQNKPALFKGEILIILTVIYLFSLFIFLYYYYYLIRCKVKKY